MKSEKSLSTMMEELKQRTQNVIEDCKSRLQNAVGEVSNEESTKTQDLKPLECMGDYVKTKEDLISKKDIVSIHFDKSVSVAVAVKWAEQSGLNVLRVKYKEDGYALYMKDVEHTRLANRKRVELQEGIKVIHGKEIAPSKISFDKKVFHNIVNVSAWLSKHKYPVEGIVEEKQHFVLKLNESTAKEKSRELEKGVCQSYSSAENQGERNTMSKLLERPQRFAFHTPIEVVAKGSKAVNDEFTIEGFASTGDIDRDSDIVEPKAFEKAVAGYMENPILCYMHNWEDPIGVVTFVKIVKPNEEVSTNKGKVKSETGGLFIKATVSKTAPKIRSLIEEGVLKAFSIGFMINDAVWDEEKDIRRIKEVELYEISVVSIPSNRRSLFSMSKALQLGSDVIDANDSKLVLTDLNVASEKVRARIVQACKNKHVEFVSKNADEAVESYCKYLDIDLQKKDYAKKESTQDHRCSTSKMEGEHPNGDHKHDVVLKITKDDMGKVTGCEGQTDEQHGHMHPVMEMGKTETIDGHYHMFNVEDAGDTEIISAEKAVIEYDEYRTKYQRIQKKSAIVTKNGHIERYLNTAAHEQKVLTGSYSYFELALYAKALKELTTGTDQWSLTKIINLGWNDELVRPVYSYLETGRDQKEELLVDGVCLLKNKEDQKVAASIYPTWSGFNIDFFYGKELESEVVTKFIDSLDEWVSKNNFYKGEKISFFGKFLPKTDTSFENLILPEEQKTAIKVGALDFFDKKEMYEKNNLQFKRGMIFAGEPGTGKTMTGKVLLANCKTTFIWVTAGDVNWSSDVKNVFAMARKLAPCILFAEDMDDFLASKSVVDALKTEMDGLKSNDGIVTILSTNFPENIPVALIDRPGRFDNVLKFELPDETLRLAMLVEHSKNMEIEDKNDILKSVAAETNGFSGAHLKELLVYSLLLALDDGREKITNADIQTALSKMQNTRELISSMNVRKALVKDIEAKSFEAMARLKAVKEVREKSKKKEKTYKVPKEIMEQIIKLATQVDEVDMGELLSVVLYMEDMVEHGTEKANIKYYVREIERLVQKQNIQEKELKERFNRALVEVLNNKKFSVSS